MLVFSVFVGLNARGLTVNAEHGSGECLLEQTCGHGHDHHHHHGPAKEKHRHGGEEAPYDHHHHNCCHPAMPLTVEIQQICRLGISGLHLFGFRHEGELTPEEPVLGSEKPPLI